MLFLGLLEANAVLSERYLLVVATAITALRVMHTLQLAFPKQLPIGFRMLGFIGTIAFFAVFSILCILVGLQVCLSSCVLKLCSKDAGASMLPKPEGGPEPNMHIWPFGPFNTT